MNCSIAIDGRNLMHPLGGNASYIISAINALSDLQPDWRFLFLTNRPLNAACAERIIWRPNVSHLCKGYTQIGLLWYVTQLYWLLKQMQPMFFWAPATVLPPWLPTGVKRIVTVNDLVAKKHRGTMASANRWYHDVMFDRSIRQADILLAISRDTAHEVAAQYPLRHCREITVGCGIETSIFSKMSPSAAELNRLTAVYGVTAPFLLFVGTIEPRKNLAFMLRLMPKLAEQGLMLLVVGAQGWGNSSVAEILQMPGFPRERVVIAGHVPTGDLVKLYHAAAAYISTSHHEGFGLPQLEAMQCGCPVISPHNSAMIELVDGAGITVRGWNPEDWYAAVDQVLADPEHYRKRGYKRAGQYDWNNIAPTIAEQIIKQARGMIQYI